MRSFLLQALFLSMPYWAIAQLKDGSFAPDFELQDLNGNTWHLYELLESGKHVILDFSATWCAPCWWYHETGLLNEAYTLYGPQGTDELMIFMIEGMSVRFAGLLLYYTGRLDGRNIISDHQ